MYVGVVRRREGRGERKLEREQGRGGESKGTHLRAGRSVWMIEGDRGLL
jgi:hypothetical protein